jgi:photosystem II stability/assembly factor-like uncharacterized protein
MNARRRLPFLVFAGSILTLGMLTVFTLPAPSQEKADPGKRTALLPQSDSPLSRGEPRQKEITDLEKQIQALNKRLNELRHANGAATSPLPAVALDSAWLKSLHWRSIGPANMGGRIIAISVYEADPTTYFLATASGGLLKTVNNGVTFEHQFDHQSTVSIGDVCVAPSDRNVVWVGTGEANPRNSVSYGDGVYKSTDGGKTWQHMGLKNSYQVGRILIHPKDPNTVYVGALGRLYGPNEERGVFKTTDGGKTWHNVLYADENTGVIDMQMSPADQDTILAALWERRRDEYDTYQGWPPLPDGYDAYDPIVKYGKKSGIYRTTDGGKSWTKVTKGLPTNPLGRIGLDFYRKDPKVVYAIIDCAQIGAGPPGPSPGNAYLGIAGNDADAGARVNFVEARSPAAKAGLKPLDIILAIDDKPVLAYSQLADILNTHKAGDKVKLRIARQRQAKDVTVTLGRRPGGQAGIPPRRPFAQMYSGQRENEQDKQGPNGFQYGGIYKSTDGGVSWKRVNSLNPRPMYFSVIRVDPQNEKYLYVLGITFYRSEDGGKTFKPTAGREVHPDQHALWIDPRDGRHMIVGCDGGFYATYDRTASWDHLNHTAIGQFYHVALDTRHPYRAYGGLQDNGSWGGPSHSLSSPGPTNADWIMVGGGDGFVCAVDPTDPDVIYCESQNGFMLRRNLRTGEFLSIQPPPKKGLPGGVRLYLSAMLANRNNPLATAANLLLGTQPAFRRDGYRFNWRTPFILSSHNPRIFYCGGEYVFRSLDRGKDLRVISPEISRTSHGSATALAESPVNPDVLYAGTDDGALWVTRDGGKQWRNIAATVPLPGPRCVASIEASRFAEGRAYVVFDAHRSNDDAPYAFVTDDFGRSWRSLRANLPTGSTRVLREDIENPDLLFLGTEFGCWLSLDQGTYWMKLNNNLPTVAVHEFALHPTAGELVAATHGRSLWVLDVTPLRQMRPAVLKEAIHLYEPQPAVRWHNEPGHESVYGNGARHFVGQNPPSGAQIYYSLREKAQAISLKVLDYDGKVVQTIPAPGEPGLHRVTWNLMRQDGPQRGRRRFGPQAEPGMYRVVLTVDGKEHTQGLRVEADPNGGTDLVAPDMEDEDGVEHR